MAGYTKNSNGGYSVNYEDQRFTDVKTEQVQQEAQVNQTYDNIINNSDKYYQDQIDATKQYADKQSELQQAQTDFAIQQIEQQKEQTQKDYTKEQKASYADYMKQTKSNAQNMANSGLSNTGYSESSIVSMYNQYQNRVGSARESLNQAILNYNNSIQQATLANNEKLAEIAFNALQTQNQLNQQAFEYKNSMILQKESVLQEVNDRYYARYQDVLAQINNEIDLQMALDQIDREYEQWMTEYTEQVRQFNVQHEQWMKEFDAEQEQMRIQNAQWDKEFALKQQEANASIAYTKAQMAALNTQNNPYGDTKEKDIELSTNGKAIRDGFTTKNIKNTKDEKLRKQARDKIYYDVQWGRINDEEADYLFDYFGL